MSADVFESTGLGRQSVASARASTDSCDPFRGLTHQVGQALGDAAVVDVVGALRGLVAPLAPYVAVVVDLAMGSDLVRCRSTGSDRPS